MDTSSLKLSGFCHSCSSLKPLDKIILSHRPLESDLDIESSQAEFFQNVDELREIACDTYLAGTNFKYAWQTKNTAVSPTFVEWKTMETSMEDGLLGRAAVSRTSTEYTPWEMPRALADSSESFSQFDSFNYGSRQDYRRRLRKASMIKELNAVTLMKCPPPEFFEGISSVAFPQNRNRRDWDGDLFGRDTTSIQDAAENRQKEEFDSEGIHDSHFVTLDFQGGLEHTTNETSNHVERSNPNHLPKICGNTKDVLPSQESQAERTNCEKTEEQHRRRRRFPPPLPSLRKTSSLLPHKVPLQLLQPVRSKGRLILQEVQVTSQMVFQPIRKDGRLELRLFSNGNKGTDRYKSTELGLMTTQLRQRPNLEMNSPNVVADVGDGGDQSTLTDQNEDIESVPLAADIWAKGLSPEETDSSQATLRESTEGLAPAETEIGLLQTNSKSDKLRTRHLGVLQTMQQILFQTIQYRYDQEYQNELIRNFAARALKLTLCRAALRNAEKKSAANTNSANMIGRNGADSINIQCVKDYEASFSRELDPNDPNSNLFHTSHNMLDTEDPSMQHCRYKGNRRQADEGLTALWETHCIAT